MELKVGQIVFVEPIGNAARKSKGLTESKVTEIGRKFFKIDGSQYSRLRFHLDSLKNDGGQYISDYKIWLSEQEYNDSLERMKLSNELSQLFRYKCDLPLEKLRAIKKIIEDNI